MKELKEINKKTTLLLIFIILVLSIILILSLTGEIHLQPKEEFKSILTKNNETPAKQYTYDEIKGLYIFESKLMKDENGNEYKKSYTLYLYENGTFRYRNVTFAPTGYIGNYIIVDNTIKLNYLYSTNSGVGIFATKGSSEIKIVNPKEIIMQEDLLDKNNKNGVTLKKDDSSERINQYEKTTVNDLIEAEEKMNQATTKNK